MEALACDLLDALVPAQVAALPRHVKRACSLLQERIAHPWSLSELAFEAGVHPMHLARAFRRYTGESIGQALRRLRVERASRLLVETSSSLAEIATASGFADQAHLTRVFRRHTAVTPARYRACLHGTLRSFKP